MTNIDIDSNKKFLFGVYLSGYIVFNAFSYLNFNKDMQKFIQTLLN